MSRHVAFDFDGTLVRSNRIKRDCFHEAVADLPGAAAVLDALFAGGFEGDRHALLGELVRRLRASGAAGVPDAAALVERYGRACRARIAAAPEVPGARAALMALAQSGARLYLVSATPQAPLAEVAADRGLAGFFDRVLGGPTGKAEHLRAIMAERGIGADGLVLVGDGGDDQAAARAVGCRFVAVTDEPKAPLTGVGESIPDLTGLPALLGLSGVAAPAATPASLRGAG